MSDLAHTHLSIGVVDGCPACDQLAGDLRTDVELEVVTRVG